MSTTIYFFYCKMVKLYLSTSKTYLIFCYLPANLNYCCIVWIYRTKDFTMLKINLSCLSILTLLKHAYSTRLNFSKHAKMSTILIPCHHLSNLLRQIRLGLYSNSSLQSYPQWKGINRKQSTRWQHLSWLKASAFFSLQKNLVVIKHSNLYLGLVLPSGD